MLTNFKGYSFEEFNMENWEEFEENFEKEEEVDFDEKLSNDEISAGEAGFLQGYEGEEEDSSQEEE